MIFENLGPDLRFPMEFLLNSDGSCALHFVSGSGQSVFWWSLDFFSLWS